MVAFNGKGIFEGNMQSVLIKNQFGLKQQKNFKFIDLIFCTFLVLFNLKGL